jgi:hypothetical protein
MAVPSGVARRILAALLPYAEFCYASGDVGRLARRAGSRIEELEPVNPEEIA